MLALRSRESVIAFADLWVDAVSMARTGLDAVAERDLAFGSTPANRTRAVVGLQTLTVGCALLNNIAVRSLASITRPARFTNAAEGAGTLAILVAIVLAAELVALGSAPSRDAGAHVGSRALSTAITISHFWAQGSATVESNPSRLAVTLTRLNASSVAGAVLGANSLFALVADISGIALALVLSNTKTVVAALSCTQTLAAGGGKVRRLALALVGRGALAVPTALGNHGTGWLGTVRAKVAVLTLAHTRADAFAMAVALSEGSTVEVAARGSRETSVTETLAGGAVAGAVGTGRAEVGKIRLTAVTTTPAKTALAGAD